MTRAIGIVRVSEVGDRDEEAGRFHSPDDQADAIRTLADDHDWKVDVYPAELNVSGGALLEDRPQLSRAVTTILSGKAQILVARDASRLWRNNEVRAQVLRLVEGAGGEVWTWADGRITNGTARTKFVGTVTTGADEMYREEIGEKVKQAHKRVVANGGVPFVLIPGLSRKDGKVVKNDDAPIVAEAVRMRADGATIKQVRTYLAEHGIERSQHGTQRILRSRLLIGEVVFGKLRGECPAIVDPDLYDRAQRTKVLAGRPPKSEMLLARQRVLYCASCGSRLTVGRARGSYPVYVCPYGNDCRAKVTISARVAEEVVVEATLAGLDGQIALRGAQEEMRKARAELAVAQSEREALVAILDPLEAADRERLAAATARRDRAREVVESMDVPEDDEFVVLAESFPDGLSLADQRRCIRAVIERVEVRPSDGGSPRDRLDVQGYGFRWDRPPFPRDLSE